MDIKEITEMYFEGMFDDISELEQEEDAGIYGKILVERTHPEWTIDRLPEGYYAA